MATHPSNEQSIEKLFDLIADIRIAMMTTVDEDGSLRARPMYNRTADRDNNIWFFTRASAPKAGEIERERKVCLAFADTEDQHYVSVSGTARVVRDRTRIEELWQEPMRTWFPEGRDDPDLALICVRPEKAEYWDSPSATLLYLYGYAKTALTGEPPKAGENRKLSLG